MSQIIDGTLELIVSSRWGAGDEGRLPGRGARALAGTAGGTAGVEVRRDAVSALEGRLAALEGGAASVALPSGRSAASALLGTLEAGEHVVAGAGLGEATQAALAAATERGVEVTFADTTDLVSVAGALTRRTKLVWLRTPAGPGLAVSDIRAIALLSRLAGARVVVDNSTWTAGVQRPLLRGADVVIYTEPAALVGGGDVPLGAVIAREEGLVEAVRARSGGWSIDPAEARRALLGLQTLALRVHTQEVSAAVVARELERNPHVRRVVFPGLDSFAQRDLVRRQATGIGSVIAIEVRGGANRTRALAQDLRVFTPSPTTGGNSSVFTASVERGDVLLLSIGLEDLATILADLERALRSSADAAVPTPATDGHGAARIEAA